VTMAREYVFRDEWDVDAAIEDVFATLADPSTYPLLWKPVYRNVVSRGEVGVGHTSDHYFKGRLTYPLRLRGRDDGARPAAPLRRRGRRRPPRHRCVDVRERDGKTHVRWDWTVHADKPLLRVLTPLLRPLFRSNHNWAVARAREGRELYVRSLPG
jgi:hypothetical protein